MKVRATEGRTCEIAPGHSKGSEPAESNTLPGEGGASFQSSFVCISLITLASYSILPAITLDGMIECMIIEGSFNTERFTSFIKDLLLKMAPFPAPKSVIVMDNCAIHKAPEIRDLIEER